MRRLLVLLVAVVALVAAVFAFARSSGANGAIAFALVDPNSGSPQLVQAHTSGFVGVNVGAQGVGDYCLTPAPGIDVVHTAAVASEEAFYSDAVGTPLVRYQPSSPNCGAGQLEVKTLDNSPAPSDQIAFTVIVP